MTPAVEVEGYAEVRASYQVGVDGVPWNLVERARPSFKGAFGDRITVEAVVEAAFIQGRDTTDEAAKLILESELGPLLEEAGCGYTPAPRYEEVSDYLSVARLHLDLNLKAADISIGRQGLNWGAGLAFHPTDLFAEVVATEPWRERRGVNAVKATVPFGRHQVVAVVALADDLSSISEDKPSVPLAGAVKGTLRAGPTDVSAVGQVRTDGDWFAGGEARGTLGVGWWVEGGWHGQAAAAEVVAGVDYSFDVLQSFYLAAEYRYDASGAAPEDYDFSQRSTGVSSPFSDCAFLPTASATEPRSTLGIHYVDAVVRLGITEELGVSNFVLLNVLDGTGMLVPDVALNVGDHVTIHLGGQIPFGREGEFRPAADAVSFGTGDYAADLSGLLPDATVQGWARYAF